MTILLTKSHLGGVSVFAQALILSAASLTLIATQAQAQAQAQAQEKHAYVPPAGFVPDEATATAVAIAVASRIYGPEIASQKPYRVKLGPGGRWVVEGSLPEGWRGGVFLVELAKADGRILRVSHGR